MLSDYVIILFNEICKARWSNDVEAIATRQQQPVSFFHS